MLYLAVRDQGYPLDTHDRVQYHDALLVHEGQVLVGLDGNEPDARQRATQSLGDLQRPSVLRHLQVAEDVDLHDAGGRPYRLSSRWTSSRASSSTSPERATVPCTAPRERRSKTPGRSPTEASTRSVGSGVGREGSSLGRSRPETCPTSSRCCSVTGHLLFLRSRFRIRQWQRHVPPRPERSGKQDATRPARTMGQP